MKNDPTERPRFTVTFEPLPPEPGEPPPPPADVRVRQLLKLALRGLRLKAVEVHER